MRSFSSKFCNLLLEHRLAALFLIPLRACINPCTAAAVQLSWMKHPSPAGTAAVSLRNLLYLPLSSRFFSLPPFFHPLAFPVLLSVRYSIFSLQLSLAGTELFFFFKEAQELSPSSIQQNSPALERWVALTTLFLLLEANSSERWWDLGGWRRRQPKSLAGAVVACAEVLPGCGVGRAGLEVSIWELMGRALTPPIRRSPIGSEGQRCSGWINIGASEKAGAGTASAT